jgi:hypothetical protein
MKPLVVVIGSFGISLACSFGSQAYAQPAGGEAPPAAEPPAAAPTEGAPPAAAPPAAAPPAAAQPAAPPPGAAPPPPGYGTPPPGYGPPQPPNGEPPGAHTHDGFFMRLGLDFGPVGVTEKVSVNGNQLGSDIKWSGFTIGYDLLLGGSPVPGLAIGGAILLTTTKDPKVEQGSLSVNANGTMVTGGVAFFGDFYPDPHGGGHILAMLGYSSISYVSTSGQSTSNSPTGLMAAIGGGYEFWIANQWSIGPVLRLMYANMNYESNGAKDSASMLYPSIGVGFTLH